MLKKIAQTFIKPIIPTFLWDKIRLFNIRFQTQSFKKYWVQHQFGKINLHVYISDPVSKEWYDQDSPEPSEIQFLKDHGHLKKNSIIFDLGAHQGVVASLLAHETGPEGRVIAVEALKHNYEIAQEILKKNKIENITFLHAAAGAKAGTVTFNENFNGQVDNGQGRLGQIQVRVLSVDDLVQQFGKPQLIFIDVEGFEWEVLKGCENLLLNDRPDFFIEIHAANELEKFKTSSFEILNYLNEKNYRLYYKKADSSEEFFPLKDIKEFSKTRDRFFCIAIH